MYLFTDTQKEELRIIVSQNWPVRADFYRALRTLLEQPDANESSGGLDGAQLRLWLEGAEKANAGQGLFSTLIRDYTAVQARLRNAQNYSMQEASNAVADNLIEDLRMRLSKDGPVSAPTLAQVAEEDAKGVGAVVFKSLPITDSARTTNAAWSGALLFSMLGGNEVSRLFSSDDTNNSPRANTLDDLKNIVFAIKSFKEAFGNGVDLFIRSYPNLPAAVLEGMFKSAFISGPTASLAIAMAMDETARNQYLLAAGDIGIFVKTISTWLGAPGSPSLSQFVNAMGTLSASEVLLDLILRDSDAEPVLKALRYFGESSLAAGLDKISGSSPSTSLPDALLKAIEKYGLDANFTILGNLSRDELVALSLKDSGAKNALLSFSPLAVMSGTSPAPSGTTEEPILAQYMADRAAMYWYGMFKLKHDVDNVVTEHPVEENAIYTDVASGAQVLVGASTTRKVIYFGGVTASQAPVEGGALKDHLYGTGGEDYFIGQGGNDVLIGKEGADRLDGGAGADILRGGADNDTYVIDNTGDAVIELADEGFDTVEVHNGALTGGTYVLTAHVEKAVLQSSTGQSRLIGNALNNQLVGNESKNDLLGNLGADYLEGGPGDDQLYNNELSRGSDDLSADILKGGAGFDQYFVGHGDIVEDSDQYGEVYFNGFRVQGGLLDSSIGNNGVDSQGRVHYFGIGQSTGMRFIYEPRTSTLTVTAGDKYFVINNFAPTASYSIDGTAQNPGQTGLFVTSLGIKLVNIPNGNLANDLAQRIDEAQARRAFPVDPLILDLNKDGVITTTAANAGAKADLNADGFAESSGWAAATEGFVVRDLNGNGTIDSGRELMGDQTLLPDGTFATNGFQAIAVHDTNGDGKVDVTEATNAGLKIWKDADSDGQTDEGELLSFEEAGVSSVNTSYQNANTTDANGNTLAQVGSFTSPDGTTGKAGSFLLNRDTTNSVPVKLVDVPDAVQALPDIVGFGNMYSLHQAMARRPELVTAVQALTSSTNYGALKAQFESLLQDWAGAAGVPPESRGTNVDARQLAVLEAFYGDSFRGADGPNPNNTAGPILQDAYKKLTNSLYAQFLAQAQLKPVWETVTFEFNDSTGKLEPDFSQASAALLGLLGTGLTSSALLAYEFGRSLLEFGMSDSASIASVKAVLDGAEQGLSQAFSAGTVGEVFLLGGAAEDSITASSPGVLVGLGGNDSLVGSNKADTVLGGDSSDTLSGRDGDDLLVGGEGDDILDGGKGRDVLDGGAGNDVLGGAPNGADSGYYFTAGFPAKYEDPLAGNVYKGGLGNDMLRGTSRADTYLFNLGDGSDTIQEVEVSEQPLGQLDVILFGQGIAPSDIQVTRNGSDLILRHTNGVDSIKVSGWFTSQTAYQVEEVRFFDGTVWTSAELTQRGLVIEGTSGNDNLVGVTQQPNTINGGAGDDVLRGGAVGDTLDGNDGNDSVYGNAGDDRVLGGAGNDSLFGNDGNDELSGGEGADVLDGGRGADVLKGGAGNDTLGGAQGSDDAGYYRSSHMPYGFIDPLAGNSYEGGTGNDTLRGTTRADVYLFSLGDGFDTIFEQEVSGQPAGQIDVLKFGPGITPANLKVSRQGIDLLLSVMGSSDAILVKNWFNNTSTTSNYHLESVEFADGQKWSNAFLTAEALKVAGTSNADSLAGLSSFSNTISAGAGNDTITGGSLDDALHGEDGNDTVNAGSGNDTVTGGAGDDTLNGQAGDDILDGGAGTNRLNGGDGNDRILVTENAIEYIDGGAGVDTLDLSKLSANANSWYTLGKGLSVATGTAQNGTKYLANIENVYGSDYRELIQGDAGNNLILGRGGNDTINSGSGTDTLDGGEGNDNFVIDGTGSKTVIGGTGTNSLQYLVNWSGTPAAVTLQFDSNQLNSSDTSVSFSDVSAFYFNKEDTTFRRDLQGGYLSALDLGEGTNVAHLRNGVFGFVYGGSGSDHITLTNVQSSLSYPSVQGRAGADTYIIQGATVAVIKDDGLKWDSTQGKWVPFNTSGDSVTLSDVQSWRDVAFQRQSDGSIWLYTKQGAQVRLQATNGDVGIESISFGSGTSLSFGQFLAQAFEVVDGRVRQIGTNGNDYLEGLEWIQNRLDGLGGDDILIGSPLPDQLFGGDGDDSLDGRGATDLLDGGLDNDTYIQRIGDGHDLIVDGGGQDSLLFQGALSTQASFLRTGDNLLIQLSASDSVEIIDWFVDATRKIESIVFADKTFTHQELDEALANPVVRGTAGSDVYAPWSPLNDTNPYEVRNRVLDLGEGDDQAYLYNGQNTFLVGRNSGHDAVFQYGSSEEGVTLKLAAGVNPSEVAVATSLQGDVRIVIGANQSSVNIGRITEAWRSTFTRVEFADGTVWTDADIKALLLTTGTSGDDGILGKGVDGAALSGEGGNDNLFGSSASETLLGGAGNDTLFSGGGSDVFDGGAGNDQIMAHDAFNAVVKFGLGSGNDVVYLAYDKDVNPSKIVLGPGITAQDIELTLSTEMSQSSLYPDLKLTLKATGETLTLPYWVNWNWGTQQAETSFLSEIEFSNGSKLTNAQIWAQVQAQYDPTVLRGTEQGDYLSGNGVANRIEGLAGDDQLNGEWSPEETLVGGAGNDTIIAGEADRAEGGEGEDKLIATAAASLFGGAGNDELFGSAGADLVKYLAGDGYDTFYTGGGADVVDFGAAALDSAVFSRRGDDLFVEFEGAAGALRVVNHFTAGQGVSTLKFGGVDVATDAAIASRGLQIIPGG